MFFIASSWKQRDRVRDLAHFLRRLGHEVYDFTDPACRKTVEIPPEKFPKKFDPGRQNYWEHLHEHPEYKAAVDENRRNIDRCSTLVLLLPCGIDATADWAYAVGTGKRTYIIGHPVKGETSPVHLWADHWFPSDDALKLYYTAS